MTMTRTETIQRIKKALKARSGKTFSVTGGRGTGYGWLTIRAIKAHAADEYGRLTDEDARLLGELLGLDRPAHAQGVSIPSSSDYWEEYTARAEGRKPTVYGKQYWD